MPQGEGELKIWVVSYEMGMGRVGVWSFKAHKPMRYFGVVQIHDFDGTPSRRGGKVVFMSSDDELAGRVAREIYGILTRPSRGVLDPRRILRLLGRVYDRVLGGENEFMMVTVLYHTMDVHGGRVENMFYRAVLT